MTTISGFGISVFKLIKTKINHFKCRTITCLLSCKILQLIKRKKSFFRKHVVNIFVKVGESFGFDFADFTIQFRFQHFLLVPFSSFPFFGSSSFYLLSLALRRFWIFSLGRFGLLLFLLISSYLLPLSSFLQLFSFLF